MDKENNENPAYSLPLPKEAVLETEIFFIQNHNQETYDIIRNMWSVLYPEIPFPFESHKSATFKQMREIEDFLDAVPRKHFQEDYSYYSCENQFIYNDGTKRGIAFSFEMGYLDSVAIGVLDVVRGLSKISKNKDVDVLWKIFLLTAQFIYPLDESMTMIEQEIESLQQCLNENPEDNQHQQNLCDYTIEQGLYPERDKKIKKMIDDLLIQKYLKVEIKDYTHYNNAKVAGVVKAYHQWIEASYAYESSFRYIGENGEGRQFLLPVEWMQTLHKKSPHVILYDSKMEDFYNDYGGIFYHQFKIVFEDGTTGKIDMGYSIECLQNLIKALKQYEHTHSNNNHQGLKRAIGLGYKTLAPPVSDRLLRNRLGV